MSVDEAAQLHATGKPLKPSSGSSLDVPIKTEAEPGAHRTPGQLPAQTALRRPAAAKACPKAGPSAAARTVDVVMIHSESEDPNGEL